MRKQTITLSLLLQGLVKHGWVEAFHVASPRHPAEGAAFLRTIDHSSRPTRSTVCSFRRCAILDAAPVESSGEQVFAAGGAEKIAELLAAANMGEDAVFYNRVGAINRDLSVLMANVLAEERLKESLGLAGKKRKKRKVPLPSQPSPDNGIMQGEDSRRKIRSGVKSFFSWALRRISRRRLDGSDATVLAEEGPRGTRPQELDEDEVGLVVLDAFAASGVRALRYLTEVPRVRRVVANDYDVAAIDLIRQAADLCGAGGQLEVHRGDAIDAMYSARAGGLGTYDLIDIDPFGCAAGFLDAAVQAVTDGGLLCVTSTDMPVLSGVQPEVAWSRYGSVPTRSGYHHEMSLRILLHAISAAAGRHRRSIEPVLSVAIDHYVRVFVRVSRSPKAALAAGQERTSYVLQSESCSSFFLLPVLSQRQSSRKGAKSRARRRPESVDSEENPQPPNEGGQGEAKPMTPPPVGLGGLCPETGGQMQAGGPIWSGPLHDEAWVARAIAIASAEASPLGDSDDDQSPVTQEPASPAQRSAGDGVVPRPRLAAGPRVESLLRAVSQELPDVPLFYNLRDMFATLGLKNHPRRDQVMGALEAAGYRTSGMHKEPLAIKTDAPDAAVWDVLRCWARDNPQPGPARAAGLAILGRGTQLIAGADFEAGRAGVESRSRGAAQGKGGFLHAHNPEQDWGPLARRSVMATGEDEEEESAERPALLSSE